jgi:hypothetical protein
MMAAPRKDAYYTTYVKTLPGEGRAIVVGGVMRTTPETRSS